MISLSLDPLRRPLNASRMSKRRTARSIPNAANEMQSSFTLPTRPRQHATRGSRLPKHAASRCRRAQPQMLCHRFERVALEVHAVGVAPSPTAVALVVAAAVTGGLAG